MQARYLVVETDKEMRYSLLQLMTCTLHNDLTISSTRASLIQGLKFVAHYLRNTFNRTGSLNHSRRVRHGPHLDRRDPYRCTDCDYASRLI